MPHEVLAFPKPVRETDPDYLRFIRRQGCLLHSQIAAESHHVKTRGAGGSDFRTVPLCRQHHKECHDIGRLNFEVKYGLDFNLEMVRLLESYLSAFKDGVDLGAKS
jgi:hypothetical protein